MPAIAQSNFFRSGSFLVCLKFLQLEFSKISFLYLMKHQLKDEEGHTLELAMHRAFLF